MRHFESGDKVISTTRLKLKKPIPEFGDHIPTGTRGVVQSSGVYQGVRTMLIAFANPVHSSVSHLYTVCPVQIERTQ